MAEERPESQTFNDTLHDHCWALMGIHDQLEGLSLACNRVGFRELGKELGVLAKEIEDMGTTLRGTYAEEGIRELRESRDRAGRMFVGLLEATLDKPGD